MKASNVDVDVDVAAFGFIMLQVARRNKNCQKDVCPAASAAAAVAVAAKCIVRGKVFNLLHMHKQNESETVETGEAGETGASLASCCCLGVWQTCMHAALSRTHSQLLALTLYSCRVSNSSGNCSSRSRLPFSLTLLALSASLKNELLSGESGESGRVGEWESNCLTTRSLCTV